MTGNAKRPEFIRHSYKLTHAVKTYSVYSQDEVINGTPQLTEQIRIEQYNGKSNAYGITEYLRLRTTTNWATCEKVTGLRPTHKKEIFHGNRLHPITGKRTLLIFQVSENRQNLFIDVFRGFYPNHKGILQDIINTY